MSETVSTEETEKMSAEERAMMEQWSSMAEDDSAEGETADSVPTPESEGGNARILNQEEIDSLWRPPAPRSRGSPAGCGRRSIA